MRININTSLGYVLLSLLIASCSSLPPVSSLTSNQADQVEPAALPANRSAIATCGGALAPAVSTNIDIEYKKLTAKVDENFKQYVHTVLTANNVSQEKYDAFMDCVVAVETRELIPFEREQRRMACENARNQCANENKDCLKQSKEACFGSCDTNMKLSRNVCMDECAFGNLDKSTSSKVCVKHVANCEATYSACMDSVK